MVIISTFRRAFDVAKMERKQMKRSMMFLVCFKKMRIFFYSNAENSSLGLLNALLPGAYSKQGTLPVYLKPSRSAIFLLGTLPLSHDQLTTAREDEASLAFK